MSRSKLDEVFDLAPISNEIITQPPAEVIPATEPEPENDTAKLDQDLDNVRATQYDLIQKGQESIDELIDFAKSSESPRAWEVVANLIKTTSEVADSLARTAIEKQKQKSLASQKKETNNNTNITNNSIFVGSTAELQKLLKGKTDENV